jgi:hypothetical protein
MAGPQMSETKKFILALKPVEIHYKRASKNLGMRWTSVANFLRKIEQPEGFANVRSLGLFVDSVKWMEGCQHARNAILDRIESKAARITETTIADKRQPMYQTKGAKVSESDAYMEDLEADIAIPEMDEEGPGIDDILN